MLGANTRRVLKVIDVSAAAGKQPSAAIVLMSATMPAPPEGSSPRY
jgi:hypothetical protein